MISTAISTSTMQCIFNWLLDVLGYEFLTTHQVKEITIRFDREVEYGNLVESHFETIRDENHLETLHEIRIGETTYCEAANEVA